MYQGSHVVIGLHTPKECFEDLLATEFRIFVNHPSTKNSIAVISLDLIILYAPKTEVWFVSIECMTSLNLMLPDLKTHFLEG